MKQNYLPKPVREDLLELINHHIQATVEVGLLTTRAVIEKLFGDAGIGTATDDQLVALSIVVNLPEAVIALRLDDGSPDTMRILARMLDSTADHLEENADSAALQAREMAAEVGGSSSLH